MLLTLAQEIKQSFCGVNRSEADAGQKAFFQHAVADPDSPMTCTIGLKRK